MKGIEPGTVGVGLIWFGLIATVLTIIGYIAALKRPESPNARWTARVFYGATAISMIAVFGILAYLHLAKQYKYEYVWSHSSSELSTWYRFASTWAGQEGSFLLWGAWTAFLGFLMLAKAGRYEARVMPFYVSILGFLFAILAKQSPFNIIPMPSAADLAANPDWRYPPPDGQGLNPSLQNYWMTIHPPTIFFGFASLAVPYCYAIAAMLWKDYEKWTPRVMPYALLSCATLGIGLFMGGYWAYETQGWHGFWAWDPVENASFFPWLAVTALVHGLVVQRNRGGMARTNTFLGVAAFGLFLVGTFLTRSGALAQQDENGQLLSVHAFANIGKSGLVLMAAMLIVYFGGGFLLWLAKVWKMPQRQAMGETLVSRDFAFFVAVLLMILACVAVTLGTTQPLVMSWLDRPPSAPKPAFYNKVMLPLALLAALAMGCVPWLAWKRTNPETFLRKLVIPWFLMLGFGFFMVFWVQGAQRAMEQSFDPTWPDAVETANAWISPTVQRLAVVALSALGFFAALSNAMLAYRVFRAKPLAAGGWLAHVGIGLLIIGAIVSNTYERTERILLREGDAPKNVFGYKVKFEKMTGAPPDIRPLRPEYDRQNTVAIRVTPPGADQSNGKVQTFVVNPKWFVFKFGETEDKNQTMRWPAITAPWHGGHDFYVGIAADPIYQWPTDDPNRERPGIVLQPKEKRQLGPYRIGYFQPYGEPGKVMGAHLAILTPEGKVVEAMPAKRMTGGNMMDAFVSVPEIPFEDGSPGAVYLDRLDAKTKAATLRISLKDYAGIWVIPLEITYKPWINLAWTGVLIAAAGTLLAMIRRTLEARRVDSDLSKGQWTPHIERGSWDTPEGEEVVDGKIGVPPGPVVAPVQAMAETPSAPPPVKGKRRPAAQP